MSDSDEPNITTFIEQLHAITARLERLTVAQAESDNQLNRRLGALEDCVLELQRSEYHHIREAATTTARAATTAAIRQVSPPRVLAPAADGRVQGRTLASGRSNRSSRRARPITETFVIGDDVYLLDKKQETTHYGTVIGFTRVGWAKVFLESGSTTIRKTNNITKNFR